MWSTFYIQNIWNVTAWSCRIEPQNSDTNFKIEIFALGIKKKMPFYTVIYLLYLICH